MVVKPTAAKIFSASLNKAHFLALFETYLSERSAPGSDGMSLPRFKSRLNEEIDIAIRKTSQGNYRFATYREKLLLKGKGKPPRVISVPTIRDKLVLKFLSELLVKIYPEHKASLPHGIVKQVHELSSTATTDDVFLRLDIKDYYPSINHRILLRVLRQKVRQKKLFTLIENAIKTPTGRRRHDKENVVGIPQGLSVSNILASLYLSDIDAKMRARHDLHYFRYVDDILILTQNDKAQQIAGELSKSLKSRKKLICHKIEEGGKSRISSIQDGMDYLGYHFAGSTIRVRESSFKKLFSNLTRFFTSMKYHRNNKAALWRLNIRISGCIYEGKRIGWMFYFSQTEDMGQLKRLDYFVHSQCKKYLTAGDLEAVKTFTKSYHEIRYRFHKSTYFPNFDNFDDDQKRAALKSLLPRNQANRIDSLTTEELEDEFRRVVSREINELERDMLDAFS